ncbi:MAG: ribosome small subunit-dependent GTPase A [Clostridia bacterium]|nr:ribosome small subunit-dependent GTPase A [Clostridia bacterium]
MNIKKGKIIKGIGGFYYVKTDSDIVECRARGLFRNKDVLPYVGDNVEIEISPDGTGYVTSIEKRKNFFIRPPIANVDLLLIIVAMANPSPDLLFLDKMLIQAKMAEVEAVICFNKSDLVTPDETSFAKIYTNLGYKVFTTSTYTGEGINDLKDAISGRVISVCGFSGVGKSSILNAILGNENQEVGEISRKLSRGKHTTREVSLIEYTNGSYLADTPGFSSLSLPEKITKDSLKDYFPEFENYETNCRFSDCVHISPKFCGVCEALDKGLISLSRYNNYKTLYDGLKDKKEWK